MAHSAPIPHHHGNGNVWADSVLQALKSPYGVHNFLDQLFILAMLYSWTPWPIFNFYAQQAPEYSEREVELVDEIKRLFFSDIIGADDDLVKRLQIVDTVESQGIDQHFWARNTNISSLRLRVGYIYVDSTCFCTIE